MKEEMAAWRQTLGFNLITRPEQDPLKKALQLASENIDLLDVAELDEVLLVLSNYYIYLKEQIGVIDGRMCYMENKLNSKVSIKSSKFNAGHALERRALAICGDAELAKLDVALLKEKMKLSMVRPIADAVKIKIDSIKKIYDRKARQERNT